MCTIDEKAAVHSADHAGADAPHTHAHTHEHGHDHGHTHEHHSPEETVALLSYMVTHNQHHAEELHELAHSVEGEAAQLLHEAVVDHRSSSSALYQNRQRYPHLSFRHCFAYSSNTG